MGSEDLGASFNQKSTFIVKDATPKAIYLKDYTQPDFWIDNVSLVFELGEASTRVLSTTQLRRNDSAPVTASLKLTGEELETGATRHVFLGRVAGSGEANVV